MKSNYAYVQYIKPIGKEEDTIDGRIVIRNYESEEGQIDLVSKNQFEMEKRNFPDRIKGDLITKDNLLNMVKYCFDSLKTDIANLPETTKDIRIRLEAFAGVFNDGKEVKKYTNDFKRDHNAETKIIEEIAEKYMNLQKTVRAQQRSQKKSAVR